MLHALWVRFEYIYRTRLGLSPDDCLILADEQPPANPGSSGGTFAIAWRNYIKTILKRGFWYNFSCWPSVFFYVSENKTLAGKEDKNTRAKHTAENWRSCFSSASSQVLFIGSTMRASPCIHSSSR